MEVTKDTFITDCFDKTESFFLEATHGKVKIQNARRPIDLQDVCFFKMKSITYEEDSPRKEALENVFSTMRLPYINVLYLIKGEKHRVSFYYGISRDLVQFYYPHTDMVDIKRLGISVLKKGLESNYRGSVVENVDNQEIKQILKSINSFDKVGVLEGVAGSNGDGAEDFQRVDRLIDVMLGDEFILLITSKYMPLKAIHSLEDNIFRFYNRLYPLSKFNRQQSTSEGTSESSARTDGTTTTNTTNAGKSQSKSVAENKGGTNNAKSFSKTNTDSSSSSEGSSVSSAESRSTAKTVGKNNGKSISTSNEYVNKKILDWLKYVDDVILKRIDYGKGNGIFSTAISLYAEDDLILKKLANTCTTLYSGETGNKMPLSFHELSFDDPSIPILKNLQIPIGKYLTSISDDETYYRTALSQYSTNERIMMGNWCSINELGIIAGLPRKEIVGLSLNEEVEFGLNVNTYEEKLSLGNLVQSGTERKEIEVALDKRDLSKHIFVCGVTGSGKTTTCMSILLQSEMPFLVIEPAKTEYRVLINHLDDILVFTLGRDDVAPFRLNPLEFLPTETISSHIDMVKASIESAFDMEAAIPQIIESALYESYSKYGWDIMSGSNSKFPNPFAENVYSFPTLSDLINTIEEVVDKQGFDERLKNDYLGSIRARLMGLTVGAKGAMLNTPRSINFRDLVHRKVVLELENIKSGAEKSLIMGFVLSQLNEAIKAEFKDDSNFRHITLVEEAHRLLSKYIPGDSTNKKNGVEVFSDMLAEIRKYGESLIIADQIPDKMTPDVLKNTNTKIVHRIFAQDDKDAIGNTMSLTQDQKGFLSNLVAGRAVVFSQGWPKSLQVQIAQKIDTTNDKIDESSIRSRALAFYEKKDNHCVFPELLSMDMAEIEYDAGTILSQLQQFHKTASDFALFLRKPRDKKAISCLCNSVVQALEFVDGKGLAQYLNIMSFHEPDVESFNLLNRMIDEIESGKFVKNENLLTEYKLIINLKTKKS